MITLTMRKLYALWDPDTVTLGDLREAINTLEEMEPIARRVFGDAHPLTESIVWQLGQMRAALRAREDKAPGGDVNAMCEAMAAMTADDA